SFKIEGRVKGINYVAGVVKVYRDAINSIENGRFMVKDNWMNELLMSSNRGFTTGMFLGRQPDTDYNHDELDSYRTTHTFVGIIKSLTSDYTEIALRNTLRVGDHLTIVCSGADNLQIDVDWIKNIEGVLIEIGKNEEIVFIKSYNGINVGDIIRRQSTAD
ncbi:MAG: U32 family peptidase C-terminal domain-containing protein, partial [Nitrospirae bacterium]|nr:U32 family peptidase C-terminal domain-containing protein [Nitrospirota bacterium]